MPRLKGALIMNKIRIGIADDERLIRESLKIILSSDPEIEVAGLCENGEAALELCKSSIIDVMLMDIRMPVCDGVLGTKLIKNSFPDTKVLILTTFKDDEYIYDALKFGASGYLLKDTSHEIILNSIKGIYNGNVIMHPEIAAKVIQTNNQPSSDNIEDIKSKYKLTTREIDIITGISLGLTNKEIGEKLFLTEGTIKNHITEILSKLELRDRTQIAIFAFKNKLADY